MARSFYSVEKGFRIYAENSDTSFVEFLFGSAAPGGDTAQQDAAPQGSIYLRTNGASSTLYQKVGNANSTADWQENAAQAAIGNWRPERVDILTGDDLSAGSVNPTTFTDNDDGIAATDCTIGHYVLDGGGELFEITGIAAPNITLALASTQPAAQDQFAVRYYLPDPAGQEDQAIITWDGAQYAKVADVSWSVASAISLTATYAAGSGDITNADTVDSAIRKLDGNNDAQDSVLGTSQGATNLGTFTGDIVSDAGSVKSGMQELETELVDTRQNTDDLITLSGVAENSTNHGTMDQGDILSDNATSNALFKETDAELTRQRGKSSASAVTAAATIDEVLVDNVSACKWYVTVKNTAAPAETKHYEIFAGHDGHAGADAANVDDSVNVLKLANFNDTVAIDLNGTGGTQTMRLRVSTSLPGGVDVYAKRVEVLF